ncbi:DUF2461 domain-containing protein [Aureivirga sp. CE67]|uniref:DUF2461 domain-containing protein n=1 Tax=Aureivirga sp. CE67 TaxID=1788983 RepID=UPI0018C9B948|nr:DUF2461 domain-containing protein [Aureivirga sp. CE67]
MKIELILNFLEGLRDNNNRDWFQENKKQYTEARDEYAMLLDALISKIRKFDGSIMAISSKDCMFRLNRDVRFSNNKEPYKRNFGAFISGNGRKSEQAGYYVHIEPGNSFIGGGIYMPQPKALKAIRTEIFEYPDEFKAIIHDEEFLKVFPEIYGDKLKTAPRGFPKDFKDIELLRHKSYAVIHKVEDTFWKQEDVLEQIISIFKIQYKYNLFLNNCL